MPNFQIRRTRWLAQLQRVREVSIVSYPIMISMLTDTAIGLVDMKIVSSLNDTALGAVGIANAVLWLLQMVAFGFMRGVKVNVSLDVGAARVLSPTRGLGRAEGLALDDQGIRFAQVGIGFGILVGLFLFGVSTYCEDLFRFAGVQPSLIPEAVEFLRARMLGAPLAYSLLALMAYSEGVSKTKEVMYVRVFGNLVNLVLVYSMVFGRLGFSSMGIRGAGYGTSCADGLQLFLLFFVVFKGSYSQFARVPSVRKVFAQISQVGSPTALSFGLDMLAYSFFALMIGKMGELQILAHQIALCLNRVPYLLGISVGEGAAILVGQALGAGDLKRAKELTVSALGMVCVLMGWLGLTSAFLGSYFASYFTLLPQVIYQTQILLGIAAAFQVFDGLSIVLRAVLRTAKDMRIPTVIGIVTIWIGLPGSAFIFGQKLGLGVTGAWLGFLVKTVLSSLLLGLRWKKGMWKSNFAIALHEVPGS